MTGKITLLLAIVLFFSCRNRQTKTGKEIVQQESVADTSKDNFFPVTTYLKGQISEIQTGGINPMKYMIGNNTTDSSVVKMENMVTEVSTFLEPLIDTSNLKSLFVEKKFLDQTINAFTFTYDPKGELPDTFPLLHWDVYVDPVSSEVRRIYMVKKDKDARTLQLTWQSDKWCRIVTISTDTNGKSAVEKEILIKWDF